MYGYIYKTTNLINNKIYIGQHKKSTFDNKYYGSGKLINLAIKKYGIENFKVELIDTANNLEELTKKEYYYINFYKSSYEYGNYNLLNYNEKGIFKHNNKSKQQISSTLKENYNTGKMTPYWKNKHLPKYMVDCLDVSNMRWYTNGEKTIYLSLNDSIPDGYYPGRVSHFGHLMSKEARQKLSEIAKGRKLSEETKQKISKSQKGKKRNLDTKQHEQYSKNASNRNTGRHWFTNGEINTFTYKCPDGFRKGYTRHTK